MTARQRKLLAQAQEALRELRYEELRRQLRQWRDTEQKDRALLFGFNEGNPELPHFCVLIERRGANASSEKFRGADEADAAAQALQYVAAQQGAS